MTQRYTPALAAAYDHCRAVARREAKNFYWAFRVLPPHKSDAMCAVYAFMRKADDLADDESVPVETRRAAMAEWTAAWRASRKASSGDPLFLAVNDTQWRFKISDTLLEQLVAGTTMDLQEELPGVVTVPGGDEAYHDQMQVYRSFEDLYRYCYLVASVVGLVTIRIFGYRDPAAERLAEETGIAFQLTNILRDVTEDAERGRVYLPLDDQAAAGVAWEDLMQATQGVQGSEPVEALLRREIARAEVYYRSAEVLVPLLDRDAQAAMRVLVTIYRELLERIAAKPEAVLRTRVSVPRMRKFAILGRGLWEARAARRNT